jgi:hypothetical protein
MAPEIRLVLISLAMVTLVTVAAWAFQTLRV